MAVAETVDLFGVYGEDRQATSEKGFDDRAVRLFDGDGEVIGFVFGQAQKPANGFRETFPTVWEACLGDELTAGIEDTCLMKPAAEIDANEKLEVVRLHKSLRLPARVMFHRPLYRRSKRNSPRDVSSHRNRRHARPSLALEARGEVWRCRRTAGLLSESFKAAEGAAEPRSDRKRSNEGCDSAHSISRALDCQV